jgi:hypothetical protein
MQVDSKRCHESDFEEGYLYMSPVSETRNPGFAYEERSLGEIGAETIQFLLDSESPTGKAAVLFSGACSGTTSLWEFEREEQKQFRQPPRGTSLPSKLLPLVLTWLSSRDVLRDSWPSFPSGCKQSLGVICGVTVSIPIQPLPAC